MKSNILFTLLTTGTLFMTSCTTYYISMESFRNQFSRIDSTRLKQVELAEGGMLMAGGNRYLANPVKTIKCTDKNGNPAELQNSPSIEIRFTYGEKNKRTVFYFDRIFVSDSSVTGVESRFISSMRKTIPLKSITKIEVQDGKKNFHYAEKGK